MDSIDESSMASGDRSATEAETSLPDWMDAVGRLTASHPATASAAPSQMLSVSGTALSPGRWYVVASNPGPRAADVALLATIGGSAPRVRPGGYFAPARSGHGLFLYPAADQWAGLWYTYLQDGRSTWYYLQGPAPGANGQWVGRIYRSAWDGSRNVLTAIGEGETPAGATAGRNDFGTTGWRGPCPPSGTHTYLFRLYALPEPLDRRRE